MNGYLIIAMAGRQSDGATRNAATQIIAGACMPDGMRSLSRKPLYVARAIVATCPDSLRHGLFMRSRSVADRLENVTGDGVRVGGEHQGAERVLQRRGVDLLAQRRR